MTQSKSLRIDLISDVVCPWCVIGLKRLEQALEILAKDIELTLDLHFHPFELNPQMPAAGENLREHLAKKYGTTPEGSEQARTMLTNLGSELGFSFDFFDEMRMPNTFKAHQLLHYARQRGLEPELQMRLFSAHFGERKNIGEEDVLVAEAEAVGLSGDEVRELLADQRYASEVRDEERKWMSRGIHSVPTFILNERLAVSGAQDPSVLAEVIRRALSDSEAASALA